MSSDLGLDVGQANELKLAFRRFDWSNELIKRLCEGKVLGDVLKVLQGDAEVIPIKREIDLNAIPTLKEGESVVKHLKQGKKCWDELRFTVFDPNGLQYVKQTIPPSYRKKWEGGELYRLDHRTERPRFLRGQRPANKCLLDFLLANQHLIPNHWRRLEIPILFWGTIIRSERDKCDYIYGMQSFGCSYWGEYVRRLSDEDDVIFGNRNPCAVLLSPPSL